MEQIVEWAYRLIVLFGLCGGLYLLKTLKGTVDAQKETITAQSEKMASMETLLRTMETVLTSTDEKNMLARLKAYKEFVDEEKKAAVQQIAAQSSEEKKKIAQGAMMAMDILTDRTASFMTSLVTFATNVMPFVPKDRRTELIATLEITGPWAPLKDQILRRLVDEAPDLSWPGFMFAAGPPSLALHAPGISYTLPSFEGPSLADTLGPPPVSPPPESDRP